jgi:hypothetical protein
MKRTQVVVILAVVMVVGGCTKNEPSPPASSAQPAAAAPAQEPVTNNSIVTQISHPDEAMKALASVAQPADWKKHLNTSTAVSSSDKLAVMAAIGMQAANGIVAEYVGDDENAQKLATSIKGLADRQSLQSAALEQLVSKTSQDFREPDASKRSTLIRSDITDIQNELTATLNRLGDGAAATMIVFGAWVEGVRMASGVLQDHYDAAASDALNRRNEAEYFLASFSAMPSNAGGIYAQVIPPLKQIRDAMAPNQSHQLDAASIKTIQAAASTLAGLLRK